MAAKVDSDAQPVPLLAPLPALARTTPTRVRFFSWMTIALFCAFLAAPPLVQIFGLDPSKAYGNRALTTWPAAPTSLKALREYPGKIGTFINDNFGLRAKLIALNSLVRYAFGTSSVKNVVAGNDGWLYYAYDYEKLLEQHTGADIFNIDSLDHWIRTFEAVQDWMHRRNIAFYITVAPDKPTIYPEHLPAYPQGRTTRLQQISERLKVLDSKLDFIDPRPALLQAKAGHLLYPKRDSHWTQRGSLIVYTELMGRVKQRFPDLPVLGFNDFDSVRMYDPSDLAWHLNLTNLNAYIPPFPYTQPPQPSASLIGQEVVEGLARRRPSYVLGSTIVQPIPGGTWGWPIAYYKTDLADRPRALIFADSFTDFVMGPTALYQTFRDPVYTHNSGGHLNFSLIEKEKPDVVIVVMAERYLRGVPTRPPSP